MVELIDAAVDDTSMVSNAAAETRGMSSTRFHSWQKGEPVTVGTDGAAAYNEQLAADLAGPTRSAAAPGRPWRCWTPGRLGHPALADRTVAGYDYVDDDADGRGTPGMDTSGDGSRDSRMATAPSWPGWSP